MRHSWGERWSQHKRLLSLQRPLRRPRSTPAPDRGRIDPDQSGHGALTDPERDVVEQLTSVRQRMANVRGLYMTH